MPGSTAYDLFLIRVGGANELVPAARNGGQVNGVGGGAWSISLSGAGQEASPDRGAGATAFRATASGDAWSLVGLVRVNLSNNYRYALTGVTGVYGVI